MKVLFAVSNEGISNSIVKKYQQMYKEIISSKNVYYFNAILKELQKDKTYDRIVISEDLEPFTNNNYDAIDNFIFEKLDSISDEASTSTGDDIQIIVISSDRRTKGENLLIKLFGIGVYSALIGQDRSVDEVCKLINKPRSKKEAKIYYKIDSNDVEYKSENDGEVSETEIQNILTYYKRLGRNEDRYVESFDSIASQYTDEQLKVIVTYLPLNVKAVLEANSPKYQQLISYSNGGAKKKSNYTPPSYSKTKLKNNTTKAISENGIKIETIKTEESTLSKPVIIPSMTPRTPRRVRREDMPQRTVRPKIQEEVEVLNKIEENDSIVEPMIDEPVRRGRGRPKKVQPEIEESVIEKPKRGRGRPKKIQPEIEDFEEEDTSILPGFDDEEEMTDYKGLPGFDDVEIEEDTSTLPGFNDEDEEETSVMPGFDDEEDKESSVMPGFDDEEDEESSVMPEFDDFDETSNTAGTNNQTDEMTYYNNSYENKQEEYEENYDTLGIDRINQNYDNVNLQNLLTSDKKVVAFVGTSKNGTSFLINNLAEMLSNQGIKTAILDLTKNRNAYYIYTKNEENLRKTAVSCTEKLVQGIAQGIMVNKNLDVYTSLPGENNEIDNYGAILSTLIKNYSLVLLDCDFATNYGYLKEAQEIYLVQSMDVLTIQPFTAYLRDLKTKKILDQNKLRVVVNKYTRVRSVTEKTIIGGMAFYNDPAMSFMTELFNRETIKYCVIPFEQQVYAKYLEGLINCNISLSGYSKEFTASLRKLANMVYPLIANTQTYNKSKYNNPKYNKFSNNNTFSSDMNDTLNKMKQKY